MHTEVAFHGGKRNALIGGRDHQGLLRQSGGFERAKDLHYARIERSGAGMKGSHVLPRAQGVRDGRGRLGKAPRACANGVAGWLEVTTKAVERHAEATGADIARRKHKIDSALQLEFPQRLGSVVNILYIELDGTQVPARGIAGALRQSRGPATPHARDEVGCVFTQTTTDDKGRPIDPASTTYTGAIETAESFGRHIYTEAWERG
jgi:hypothetical protein